MDPWRQALAGRGWKVSNHTSRFSRERVTLLPNCSGVRRSFACRARTYPPRAPHKPSPLPSVTPAPRSGCARCISVGCSMPLTITMVYVKLHESGDSRAQWVRCLHATVVQATAQKSTGEKSTKAERQILEVRCSFWECAKEIDV